MKNIQNIIKVINELHGFSREANDALDAAIGILETQVWIPVTERLPEVEDEWYWCTCYAPHRGYFTQPAQWYMGEFIKPCYKGQVVAWIEKMPDPCESEYHCTNLSSIRKMSDKELAHFLVNFKKTFGEEYEGEESCLEWLWGTVKSD